MTKKRSAVEQAERRFVEAIMDALPQLGHLVQSDILARIADAGQAFCLAQDRAAIRARRGKK